MAYGIIRRISYTAPLTMIVGLVVGQSVSAHATTTAQLTAEAKAAYKSAYANLENTHFLQMTQVVKNVKLAQLTASGEKNSTLKQHFGQPPLYESDAVRGIPASDVSYVKSETSERDDRQRFSYFTLKITLPSTVK